MGRKLALEKPPIQKIKSKIRIIISFLEKLHNMVWNHHNNCVKVCGCSLILIPHLVIVGGYVSSIL
jgi:hypothetical protein